MAPLGLGLPGFLALTDYQNPRSVKNSNNQFTYRTGDSHFQFLASHPRINTVFSNCMKQVAGAQPAWTEMYSAETLLKKNEGTALVDVGGSLGHDLEKFICFAALSTADQHSKWLTLASLAKQILAVER